MSIDYMLKVVGTKVGDSTDKTVLFYLANFADDDGIAWPSLATLANVSELSKRSVQDAIKRLKESGRIEIISAPGRSNNYKIILPEQPTAGSKKPKNLENSDQDKPLSSFDRFWEAYPKRVQRRSAEKAWGELNPDDELVKFILADIDERKRNADWMVENGRYIPAPVNYIADRRWEDEDKPKWTTPQSEEEERRRRSKEAIEAYEKRVAAEEAARQEKQKQDNQDQ